MNARARETRTQKEATEMSESRRKILLATDGSAESASAAEMARELSGGLGAEMHVLYVHPVPEAYVTQASVYDPDVMDELFERTKQEASKKAKEEAAKVGETGAEISGVHAEVGRADAEIVKLAEDLGAEMVVIGSRGLGAMRRALMGSVSTSVVRHSHGSVLVVRGETRDGGYLPGRILAAVDGSKEAEAAMKTADEIARATGSEFHLVYVLSDTSPAPYPHPWAMERWDSYFEEAKDKARAFIEKKARHVKESGGEVEWAGIVLGEADREIVRLAEELGAGLVVTGSRGMGGVRRALMGSVSDSVVRHTHCPVLVVRKQAG
jgi:nucleotide-binding universal stress UspA family protein